MASGICFITVTTAQKKRDQNRVDKAGKCSCVFDLDVHYGLNL